MQQGSTYWQTLKLITKIISFVDNGNELSTILKSDVNWDMIVKIASRHLVLPTLLTKLDQKNLVSFLPGDLLIYLEEITNLNKERNRGLLMEATEIASVLTTNQIDFVFIKGIALLNRGLFSSHHDRMIGDIDILVRPDQCDHAFDLLRSQGYSETIEFNYKNDDFRHLPRQIHKNKLAAVEIHSSILNGKKTNLINSLEILEQKKPVNDLYIPNDEHNFKIAIYTNQINNNGYYFNTVELKTIYDVLSLVDLGSIDVFNTIKHDKYTKKFLQLSASLVPELNGEQITQSKPFYRSFFILSNTYPKFGFIMFKVKYVYLSIKSRLNLFLFNKSYRNHVITNKL